MKTTNLKNLTIIAIFSALICVSALIYIPLTVPITMQTFLLCLCVGLLGTKRAAVSVLVYILIGLLGLPVFAGFMGGIGALFSNTGGFIIGFLGFTVTKGLTQKLFKNSFIGAIISSLLGLIILYIIGSIWFTFIYYGSFNIGLYTSSLAVSVLPFVLPDIIKILLAAVIEKRLKNRSLDCGFLLC